MGEPRQAIRAYRQALEIARQVGDLREQANLWGNLGNAYRTRGQADAAIHAYESALQIARELSDQSSEGIWLLNKSLVLDQQGNRAEALSCAQAARDALHQAGSPECASVDALLERWQ
jgi:tetratricopeptide (TPR) repeat protein